MQHFLSKGDEVLFLVPQDEYVQVVESWGAKWVETPLDATGNNPLKDAGYLRSLYRAFKKERPDVVLGYTIKSNIYSCLASHYLKIPTICNVSGLGTAFLVKGLMGRIALLLYRLAFRYAGYVFFQNRHDRDLFISKIKVPESKIGLLPGSGIDLQEFAQMDYLPKKTFRFLMISRLIVEKGVNEFAEAASHFVDNSSVSFTLVGKLDEGHARTIRKNILDSWIEEKWLDYLPHTSKVKELIREHDAVILPSYREGTPRTLLEAAAIGRPLLASRVPGCTEVVMEGYNGFLFEVQNSKSLVDKLKLFMALSSKERITMANNSRKLVDQKFDENLIIDAYDIVIDRIAR